MNARLENAKATLLQEDTPLEARVQTALERLEGSFSPA
jgi:hypothetical protein